MSDDGQSAVVVIALLGNPFSPTYAAARDGGGGRAVDHCAIHVALYHRGQRAWALDERSVRDEDRRPAELAIGQSLLRWDGDALVVDVDERATPVAGPRRSIRGCIALRPEMSTGVELPLDGAGLHRWWPVAPLARIDVKLTEPGVSFTGHGYHDANAGETPLSASFAGWTWSRARAPGGALLAYDVAERDGGGECVSLWARPSGEIEPLAGDTSAPLPRTRWGLARSVRVDAGATARIARPLEDGPFYARALVEQRLAGHDVLAMHETLDARRLMHSWVRFLTGFRMRRST